jgi:hypothetical protein
MIAGQGEVPTDRKEIPAAIARGDAGMAGFRLPMKPNCQMPGLARANETSRRVPVPQ